MHGMDEIMYPGGGPWYSRVKQGNRQMAELLPARGADPMPACTLSARPYFGRIPGGIGTSSNYWSSRVSSMPFLQDTKTEAAGG